MKKTIVALLAAAVFALGACSVDETTGTGLSKGLGSQDATADVKIESFTQVGSNEFPEQKGVLLVTNNSSKASDYYIQLNIEDANGVVLDWTNATVQSLQPGASARVEFSAFSVGASKAVITEVQRTESI